MGIMFEDDDFLPLSGIQHYSFCRRQWALIHVERIWQDNLLTAQGSLMHERAHDENIRERRGSRLTVRGLSVFSRQLGLSGKCDVVEFVQSADGFSLASEEGLWLGAPIEYKHGQSKSIDADRLQLCAQAMCLEEMLSTSIEVGYLYYEKTRSRESVTLDESLRNKVKKIATEMHDSYRRGHIPKVKANSSCRACSLRNSCLPDLPSRRSTVDYIRSRLDDLP